MYVLYKLMYVRNIYFVISLIKLYEQVLCLLFHITDQDPLAKSIK